MAGFNIKDFTDYVTDFTTVNANKTISATEQKVLLVMRESAFQIDNIRQQIGAWNNRTWNLISSYYIMFLYNKKLVGVETEGANVGNRKSKKSKKPKLRARGVNPVFSYQFTGKGTRGWRGDIADQYFGDDNTSGWKKTWNASVYANYAVQKIKNRARANGYLILFGFAMPYAFSSRPSNNPMRNRTEAVVRAMFENYLRKQLTSLKINVNFKVQRDSEYRTSYYK